MEADINRAFTDYYRDLCAEQPSVPGETLLAFLDGVTLPRLSDTDQEELGIRYRTGNKTGNQGTCEAQDPGRRWAPFGILSNIHDRNGS